MSVSSFRVLTPGAIRKLCRGITAVVLVGALTTGILTPCAFAQMNHPSHPPQSIILPEANRPPDANDQMTMREESARNLSFRAANAERLKQMTDAARMLETMAIALKAEVDQSGEVSQSTIQKAETIEKLARAVKEKMTITLAPN